VFVGETVYELYLVNRSFKPDYIVYVCGRGFSGLKLDFSINDSYCLTFENGDIKPGNVNIDTPSFKVTRILDSSFVLEPLNCFAHIKV